MASGVSSVQSVIQRPRTDPRRAEPFHTFTFYLRVFHLLYLFRYSGMYPKRYCKETYRKSLPYIGFLDPMFSRQPTVYPKGYFSLYPHRPPDRLESLSKNNNILLIILLLKVPGRFFLSAKRELARQLLLPITERSSDVNHVF